MNVLMTQPPTPTEPAIEAGSPEHHVTEDQAEDGLKDALADELHDNVLWPLRHAGYDAFIEVRFGEDPAEEIVAYANKEGGRSDRHGHTRPFRAQQAPAWQRGAKRTAKRHHSSNAAAGARGKWFVKVHFLC